MHRRLRVFQTGDRVMVRERPERFPPGTVKKLHAKRTGPYEVLRRIGSNAYELDLPRDLGISPVFNVEDLTPYHEPQNFEESDSEFEAPDLVIPPPPPIPAWRKTLLGPQVEEIVADEVVSTKDGGVQRYLVRWKGRTDEERTWLEKKELEKLAPDMLMDYHCRSPGGELFKEGSADGDQGVTTGTKEKTRRKAKDPNFVPRRSERLKQTGSGSILRVGLCTRKMTRKKDPQAWPEDEPAERNEFQITGSAGRVAGRPARLPASPILSQISGLHERKKLL